MQRFLPPFVVAVFTASIAQASFHLMQIEQVIGGVNGDTSAQAIQLRMRSGGQDVVSLARLRAWDANGANPILLLDIGSDVTNGTGGDRVLLTTASFNQAMNSGGPAFTSDFTLATPIPASYLAKGKLTFESDAGAIVWSLAWGGYTGPNTGTMDNDTDGNFGPSFGSSLPTGSRQGVIFDGPASDPSTNNAADYIFSPNPATVTNNSHNSFTVVPEPGTIGLLAAGVLLLSSRSARRNREGSRRK